ncbi:MAG: magnesium chelatase subunit D [Rhodocyclaceae bacterium]|nr:magnesium chelatase subunit D [Rhodocyclaceae bacterium]
MRDGAQNSKSWIAVWQLALTAAALLAVDPTRLCGVVIRSRIGPARDAWLREFLQMLPAGAVVKRIPSNIADGRLLGGLDLASTLATGRPVAERGVLAECDGGVAIFPMAERMSSYMAAKLASVIDSGMVVVERDGFQLRHETAFATVLLDEGIEDDESASVALADRLAFQVDLSDFPARMLREEKDGGNAGELAKAFAVSLDDVIAARAGIREVKVSDEVIEALTATAYALGVGGMRAPNLAINAARAIAALNGRAVVSSDDVQLAGRLILAPRATRLPQSPPPEDGAPREPQPEQEQAQQQVQTPAENQAPPEPDEDATNVDQPLEDLVLAATAAAIPEKLLLKLMMQGSASRRVGKSSGSSGQMRNGSRRGRAAGSVRGDIRSGARINILATLRAAAPWQRLRAQSAAGGLARVGRLHIRKEDFRVNRYQQRAETTTLFVVDASGSSALNRLAEAKGAVELLLADCYIRRDRVGVIAFRGRAAEVLLPATRSLVRAKRSLAGLPGGGGTPLADGIDAAREMAEALSRRGDTVVVVMLTDGKANVARNGVGGNRPLAEADALSAAKSLRQINGLRILFVDTSPTANPRAEMLADAMGATYLPLPHVGARTLMNAVQVAGSMSRAAAK